MERLDLLDKERIKTGETIERGKKIPKDRYRQVIHVVIFNSKGEMLIQQRQSFKDKWANLWDFSAGGSVIAGEKTYEAAQREVFEELGIVLDLSNVRPSFTTNFATGFDDYYIVNLDYNLDDLKLQASEVKDARWATYSEILRMMSEKCFIPYQNGIVELLFGLQEKHNNFIIGDE